MPKIMKKLAKYDYIEKRKEILINNADIEGKARNALLNIIVVEEYEKLKGLKNELKKIQDERDFILRDVNIADGKLKLLDRSRMRF